jgi:putative endonuclease
MHEGFYFAYVLGSRSHTLYIGMTGNLFKRVFQHKQKTYEGFSAIYNCSRLVWFERFMDPPERDRAREAVKGLG